jgi:hypothetical protein
MRRGLRYFARPGRLVSPAFRQAVRTVGQTPGSRPGTSWRGRVPPLGKPFGVDLDRPLEVAGRGRDDEGARDLRFDLRPSLTEH